MKNAFLGKIIKLNKAWIFKDFLQCYKKRVFYCDKNNTATTMSHETPFQQRPKNVEPHVN